MRVFLNLICVQFSVFTLTLQKTGISILLLSDTFCLKEILYVSQIIVLSPLVCTFLKDKGFNSFVS